jgi:Beta-fructosidases (levanase/invertase)
MGTPLKVGVLIGAFSSGPSGVEPAELSIFCLGNAKIDALAIWDCSMTDSQVAFLSGQIDVQPQAKESAADRAIAAYNRFYDASENKDLELCRTLERSMREFMRQDPTRPIYHLTAPIGWIYDPSGAVQFQGKYHVSSYRNIYALLRFNSLDHYVSDNLVHWRMWPTGPVADTKADVAGIWLSNHIVDGDGLPNIIYCAWGADGVQRGIRARSHDGMVSYTDKKLISVPEFHDGHGWKEGDTWYVITMRKGPEIVIFSSTDLDHWTERGVLFRPREYSDKTVEGMEFPYLFFLREKAVLMSGCLPAGVFYWIGQFDRKSFKFIPDEPEGLRVDYANPFHCFNPSTVDTKGPNGATRRIIMAMESRLSGSVHGLPWNGVHAMPRAITLDGNHLRQDPLPEFEVLRGRCDSFRSIKITPNTSGYIKLRGDALEIRAEFENQDANSFGMKVRLSRDGRTFVRIFYDAKTSEFGVDGNIPKSVYPDPEKKLGRGLSYIPKGKPVQFIVFLDKALIEAFVNGQTCTTGIDDTNPLHDGLDLFSEGGTATCARLDIWEMKPAL